MESTLPRVLPFAEVFAAADLRSEAWKKGAVAPFSSAFAKAAVFLLQGERFGPVVTNLSSPAFVTDQCQHIDSRQVQPQRTKLNNSTPG